MQKSRSILREYIAVQFGKNKIIIRMVLKRITVHANYNYNFRKTELHCRIDGISYRLFSTMLPQFLAAPPTCAPPWPSAPAPWCRWCGSTPVAPASTQRRPWRRVAPSPIHVTPPAPPAASCNICNAGRRTTWAWWAATRPVTARRASLPPRPQVTLD